MKKKTMVVVAASSIVLLAGAGAASLYLKPTLAGQLKPESKIDARNDKYVTLDKVIVMLKRGDGDKSAHYLAVDLVFKTTADKEKEAREHFPLLRSIAVRALSNYTFDVAGAKSIDQVVADIDRAYGDSYPPGRPKPFSEVMIGKLIVE
jgi:flagellar FliL protein